MEAADSESQKPKRVMKTPFQLKILERTYSLGIYPSEALRVELAQKLGLSDRQLQMWFCHRRLKDKKGAMVKKIVGDGLEVGKERGSGSSTGTGSGSSKFGSGDEVEVEPVRSLYRLSPNTAMERRVRACVEAQLGEALREDGPVLGVEFDELPPGAFGAPLVVKEHRERSGHSHEGKQYEQFDAKPIKASTWGMHEHGEPSIKPSIKSDAYGRISSNFRALPVDSPSANRLSYVQENKLSNGYGVEGLASSVSVPSQQPKQEILPSPRRDNDCVPNVLHVGMKRKSDDATSGKEVHPNEKRVQKELEKQDLLRRKIEEQRKKEMEKQDRERRKEEERMMRERQRMEEKFQREERREIERREKFLQKEIIMAEKRRQKEEIRREKEAAREKAAVERATARKMARESMELIEDERLELMELAASSKGLASIVSLNHDTLQNLDLFRDSLRAFPPKSVELKRPFAIQPWIDSEDNVGNLLMVWRFSVSFADVLGIWPFTLDEFIQALHDYDSRLLGEIHIGILKLIIRDIEEGARTPSGGSGTNQYTASNPEGGHSQIVEGAYLWGFDIHNWQKHLNPLTWPEILRQFALSAGFGPQLKKETVKQASLPDNDEGKSSQDIVSMLRNGSAAENAVAVMHEKGFPPQRKSRHRLTPGTVKFAAYHILSLEGNEGLTVLELADRIQKSGLRDLRTSKTPDASISVALSRDPILFERVAPSTYCVRPAFRKDPANAEATISAAKERIQRYVNGFLGGENAYDVEKDEDSESDVADAPEVEDLGSPSNVNISSDVCNEASPFVGKMDDYLQNELNANGDPIEQYIDVVGKDVDASNVEQGGTEIDESKSGEVWVQGLTEGEYSDLCVVERLNALVALIGVANEGNIIRSVLEDRLDTATALKKQMWSEAQLGKRRPKEEITTKFHDSSFAEGNESPLAGHITNPVQQNGCPTERSRLQLKAFIGHKAEEMYVYRSLPLGQDRRHNRYWQFVASASSNDPGSGRVFVELHGGKWRLIDSEEAFDALLTSLDTRGTRESHLHIMLQNIEISFKDNVRRNTRPVSIADSPTGTVCGSNCDTREVSSTFRIEFERNETEKKNFLRRFNDLQTWMWKECLNSSTFRAVIYGNKGSAPLLGICSFCLDTYIYEENMCTSCRRTFVTFDNKLNYLEHLIHREQKSEVGSEKLKIEDSSHPVRIRFIKILLTSLEVSVPSEALQSGWMETHRKTWGLKLQRASSSGELLQILTQFEGVIKRNSLAPDFETTEDLLGGRKDVSECCYLPGSVPQLPWIPQTTAAVALRLLEIDSSIANILLQKSDPPYNENKVEDDYTKVPSRYAYMNNIQKGAPTPTEMDQDANMKEENIGGDSGGTLSFHKRGRGRPRGRKSMGDNETLNQFLMHHHHQGERAPHGPRTVRRRPEKAAEPPRKYGEYNDGNIEMVDADTSGSVEPSESDDDFDNQNPNSIGYEGFNVTSNSPTWNLAETSSDEDDNDGNDQNNGYEINGGEDMEEDLYMSDGSAEDEGSEDVSG